MSELHEIIRKARSIAPTTREHYLSSIDQWIRFAGDDAGNWTRIKAQEFYDHLIDVQKLRPQSANVVLAALQFASKWRAHYANKPELDFAFVQKTKGYDYDEKRALEREEIEPLLRPLLGSTEPAAMRDLAILVVLLETGMRKMSLVSMSLDRTLIDPERLKATRTKYPMTWVRMKGHGTQDVAVPLSDVTCAAINAWINWLATRGLTKGPLFRGLDEKMGPRGPITTAARTPLHEDAINKMLNRRAASAGIGHIYPHQFRHTFVTWRLAAGLAPHEVAAITGHVVRGMGEMQGYMDKTVIAQKVRNSTPEWLRALVLP